jgi:hypothetical protein
MLAGGVWVMKSFIDECVFSWPMRLKWQFLMLDAKVTLSKAFDMMILEPKKISAYSGKTIKVAGTFFEARCITIGYATFVIAANSTVRPILFDANLDDGRPVVDWRNLPKEFRWVFKTGQFDEKTMFF